MALFFPSLHIFTLPSSSFTPSASACLSNGIEDIFSFLLHYTMSFFPFLLPRLLR